MRRCGGNCTNHTDRPVNRSECFTRIDGVLGDMWRCVDMWVVRLIAFPVLTGSPGPASCRHFSWKKQEYIEEDRRGAE